MYLGAFFSFIRLSNMSFIACQILTLLDTWLLVMSFVASHGVKLVNKWSKSMQTRDQIDCIALSSLEIFSVLYGFSKTLLKIESKKSK